MASSSVATSVDVLTSDERKLVVAGLESLIASASRAKNAALAAGDSDLAELRSKRIAIVSSLAAKFR